MELLQLKYFCDAAKTENFSKTAAKFFVPPSNISQMMKRLEAELGVDLFDHRGNKIVLAEAGRKFYTHVAEALALIEDAKNEAMSSKCISGDIKLSVLANRRLITEVIENFIHEYPNVNFIIRHEEDNESDCDLLIAHDGTYPMYDEKLLLVDDIVLAVNRENPLAYKERITADDLKNERYITMPRGKSLYSTTLEICSILGFVPNITIQTDDPSYVRKYVEIGLGVAFVPKISWRELFSENVVLKSVVNYTRKTSIYLPKNKKPKPTVSLFIDRLFASAY